MPSVAGAGAELREGPANSQALDPSKASRMSSREKRKRRRNPSATSEGPLEHRRSHQRPPPPKKQRKTGPGDDILQPPDAVKHALLSQYYPTTPTLRQYVLDSLPASSRLRRRKIAAVGIAEEGDQHGLREQLATLLDTTLVGIHVRRKEFVKAQSESRLQQWIDYSQRDDSHVTLSGGDASAIHFQSEIVDFVIWLLFSREKNPSNRPHHLLCDGFRKNVGPRQHGVPSSIQGLFSLYFNERVAAIKQSPWPQLLQLLGKSGESIMINLLLDCSIFLHVEAGQGNYYQLSGTPIFECEPLSSQASSGAVKGTVPLEKKPKEIVFVRSRMLYARAALNAKGSVHFGLRQIHALNRFPPRDAGENPESAEGKDNNSKASGVADNAHHIMMYMFPRQFSLHNAFTSHVDPAKTAQKFQDYTLREEEIAFKFRRAAEDGSQHLDVRIPRRLRGKLEHLVRQLQTLHARCSYAKLLEHFCPVERRTPDDGILEGPNRHSHGSSARAVPLTSKLPGKASRGRRKSRQSLLSAPAAAQASARYSSLTKLAAPVSSVSAFCQAVLLKIIPHALWGIEYDVQKHNRATFLRHVDRFIKLRRFETISLHEVMQGLKITEIDWLEPPGLEKQKCSQTDFRKRSEIFSEFVYYIFDSLLIPLIRSNFYVTESSAHRYRLFFFRQDVWRTIAEPAMAELKAKMFEEVKLEDALGILDSRRLGYSQVRLLPKQTSVRPIMNLRRRTITTKDKKMLGQSINSILGPIANMLKLEKTLHASRLGSSMSSVGDIYERISSFKKRLGPSHGPLYFAKVDVQAAFDTIPQAAIVGLMRSVPSQGRYEMVKHVEVACPEGGGGGGTTAKVLKRWHSSAKAAGDPTTFLETLARQTAPGKKNTVYVDSVLRRTHGAPELLALLAEHVQRNLVRIGKKYYRQREGIPQGSVVSSVLCNYFYADLERSQLRFLRDDPSSSSTCLLLRLIDDFLLITTDRAKAARFVTVMQRGMPAYGVTVSPAKTLVNFPMQAADGTPVPTTIFGHDNNSDNNSKARASFFPYCGTQINTTTLELARDRSTCPAPGLRDRTVSNALTVEFARRPGRNFRHKTLNAFKLQSHPMFFHDHGASSSSSSAALRNLSDALVETATKAWAYARCLSSSSNQRPPVVSPKLWTDTVGDLVEVAYCLLASRARRARYPGYECRITKTQVRWLTLGAFKKVLGRKQAGFGEVLAWLDAEMRKLEGRKAKKGGGGREIAAFV